MSMIDIENNQFEVLVGQNLTIYYYSQFGHQVAPKMNLGHGNHFFRLQKVHTKILVQKYNPNQILLDVEQARPNTNYAVTVIIT